jgi:hypothetical protein
VLNQCFGEYVGRLLTRGHMKYLNHAIVKLFLNKVTINLYIYCSFMEHKILGFVDGFFIVQYD